MYQLRPPSPPLRPWIEHYWFVTDDDGPVNLRVDAFVDARADLVFNFGAPYTREVIGGAAVEHSASNLDAQRLVPIRIHQAGHVRTTGVRFHLGGLAPFTRVALRSFTGTTAPPAAVFGPGAAALEPALGTADIDAQAAMLDAFFLERLDPEPSAAWTRALTCATTRSDATGAELALAAGCSIRQVERLFARHLGVAPKQLARVLRFQRALRHLMHDPVAVLSDVAHAAGYFDHAHFIRDFRRFTGGVPRGYRGYYPTPGPADFAPNVVVFVQDTR
ncbi:MAG: helix-turn-helix domain-containing protein [Myxococcota bacterium]